MFFYLWYTCQKKGQNCSDGVCHVTQDLSITDGVIEFEGIGIRRVTGEEAKSSLDTRQKKGIDPYKQGYSHTNYNKEVVKLCFQVNVCELYYDDCLTLIYRYA